LVTGTTVPERLYRAFSNEPKRSAPNPYKAIKNRHIKSRDRFLLPEEIPAFFDAVERSSQRDFFLIALMTGARKSNICKMRWQDVNLKEGVWLIPETKK